MKMDGLGTRGFTVLEMLVVIAVIAILASILLPAMGSAQKKAKITATQTMVDSLTLALKQYKTDFGSYPPDNSIPGVGVADDEECLHYYSAAAFVAGNNSDITSAGPYMEFRSGDLTSGGNTADLDGDGATDDPTYKVTDAWGNVMAYVEPGTNNTSSFDISSNGPNGTAGDSDDITNW